MPTTLIESTTDSYSAPVRSRSRQATAVRAVVAAMGFLVALEVATRLDQAFRFGAPVLGAYTYDSALMERDQWGLHGRPNGRFEKWTLNSLGLRGPEVSPRPEIGRIRVVALGASETFGLYESIDREWPRVLESELLRSGYDVEVLNGAVAGMSAGAQLVQLRHRLLALEPHVVVWVSHYAMFAGRTPDQILSPASPAPGNEPQAVDDAWMPRSLHRLRDALIARVPTTWRQVIEDTRTKVGLARLRASMGADFGRMSSVSDTERESFEMFVRQAAGAARESNAKFVVVLPPWRLDQRSIDSHSLSFPYVSASWINDAMQTFPSSAHVLQKEISLCVVDIRALFDTRESEFMVDAVHFNDAGANEVALAIARSLQEDDLLVANSAETTNRCDDRLARER
jgi:lysophospholipase L1-like esterase